MNAETALRIEAGVGAVDTPEGLDGEVLGRGRVADQGDDPAVDLGLVLPEQDLEGLDVTQRELLEQVHARLLHSYLPRGRHGGCISAERIPRPAVLKPAIQSRDHAWSPARVWSRDQRERLRAEASAP